jgi:ABC-type nitrate/sulfonate/bicarbonate transport system substrate-binding protein
MAGSLVALHSPIAKAGSKLRVGKAVAVNIGYVPLDVGIEYGLFQKQGLEIEEMNFAGGAKIAQAMTAEAVDISLSAGPDMAFVAKGAPEIAIASIAESAAFMVYLVGKQSNARGMEDLKGKKIGITTPGSLTDWLAERLNQVNGWTSESDRVTKVTVGGSAQSTLAALKTGQVDASIGAPQLGYELEEKHEGRLLFDCSHYVGPIELYTIFASTTLTQSNPDLVRRFLKGWLAAIAFMKTHKDETVPIASKVMGTTPAIAARTYDSLISKFSTDGKFGEKAIETLGQSFEDLKTLPGPLDMKKLYTERLLPTGSQI